MRKGIVLSRKYAEYMYYVEFLIMNKNGNLSNNQHL